MITSFFQMAKPAWGLRSNSSTSIRKSRQYEQKGQASLAGCWSQWGHLASSMSNVRLRSILCVLGPIITGFPESLTGHVFVCGGYTGNFYMLVFAS